MKIDFKRLVERMKMRHNNGENPIGDEGFIRAGRYKVHMKEFFKALMKEENSDDELNVIKNNLKNFGKKIQEFKKNENQSDTEIDK